MAVTKDQILEAIASMSVLELSQLIKEMEEKFHKEYLFRMYEDNIPKDDVLKRKDLMVSKYQYILEEILVKESFHQIDILSFSKYEVSLFLNL